MFLSSYSAFSQKDIIYNFDSEVNDTLSKRIKLYSKRLNKPLEQLNLALLIKESNGVFDLYLQEYSYLPNSGLETVLNTSNRKVKIGTYFIPVIFPCDIISEDLRKDKFQYIPYSGFYVRVLTEKGIQSVIEVRELF